MLAHSRTGSGEPLILIHGITHRRQAWDTVTEALAKEHEVIAVDLPGHGESDDVPSGYDGSSAPLVEAVEDLVRELGLPTPHVAGNSLGGLIALEMAARGTAVSATALSPAGFWSPVGQAYARAVLGGASALLRRWPRERLDRVLSTGAGRAALLGALVAHPGRQDPAVMADDLQGLARPREGFTTMLGALDRWTVPQRSAVPTMVGWGSRDMLLPRAQIRRLRRALPDDWQRKAEWTFARLMFPPGPLDGYAGRFDGPWQQGLSLWTQDYPKADRMFAGALKRLTRVDSKSVEQAVSLDDGDEIYNYPWLYAVQVGEWGLTEKQAKKLRDYLLRGGFFMADDFHGHEEQAYFEGTMKMVFPERRIVDIPDDDPIFHTVYDLDERFQMPGAEHLNTGYKKDGYVARWRGIYDDKGRVMIAMSLNSDVGDAWEWADSPRYPLKYSQLAVKMGVNYVVYAMTH